MIFYKKILKKILLSLVNYFYQKKLTKINSFKNKHKNEECYIIGGGVSLKYFDLLNFKGKKSFVINFSIFHNQFENLDATYCILFDPFWFLPFEKARKEITQKQKFIWRILKVVPNKIQILYRKMIKKYNNKFFFHHISNSPLLYDNNICFISNQMPDDSILEEFVKSGLNPFNSSLRLTIFLAIYMGFKKIYLAGCDYTFEPSMSGHWFEKGIGSPNLLIENYEKDYFDFCNKYIDIITITNNKKSQVLQYVFYEELFDVKEKYQTNTTLISKENLSVLATWPGFNI